MKPLTPAQRKRFRFFRDKGMTVKESRRLARMTYAQMSDELSRRLHERTKESGKYVLP